MTKIRTIAVLTSGGDAPGMNAAIRAVVRTAVHYEWNVYGVFGGYRGLVDNDMRQLTIRDVGGILGRGGTMLGSARAPEFKESDGQVKAMRNLSQRNIDALVVIGGNGSQTGNHALHARGFPVVGVASTIDNDLYGSEITIGVDTALNIALEAIDRLRVTASSHNRAFIIEVMGRNCGYLGLMAGIAGGAECIQIPEQEAPPEHVAQILTDAYARGKQHGMIVVAEGCKHDADKLADYLSNHDQVKGGFPLRVTKLGHVQRGGTPTAYDRLLATRLAANATRQLHEGNYGVLSGWGKGSLIATPLDEVVGKTKELDLSLLELASILDR